jgi:hypothetical protein
MPTPTDAGRSRAGRYSVDASLQGISHGYRGEGWSLLPGLDIPPRPHEKYFGRCTQFRVDPLVSSRSGFFLAFRWDEE